eukprot:Hpha_TRINITY_DN3673_c0_g1::TRINITY_DN3673_c0_g1_i1::g.983::m.983
MSRSGLLMMAVGAGLVSGVFGASQDNCFDCATQCIECLGKKDNGDGTQTVSVSAGSCKGDTVSWFCCRTQSCVLSGCDEFGPEVGVGVKCEDSLRGKYTLDSTHTTLELQVHDGRQIGNVLCSGKPNADGQSTDCCGGGGASCGGVSGICNRVVDLSTCPIVGGGAGGLTDLPECYKDSDCAAAGSCSTGRCDVGSHTCWQELKAQGTVCNAKVEGHACDVEETCSGASAQCPTDGFAAVGTVCRVAHGPCDVEEQCTGTSGECPSDAKRLSGFECRASQGVCDPHEHCDGKTNECPDDLKHDTNYVCRTVVSAADGTTCDLPESCDGTNNDCPKDLFINGNVCRPSIGLCDEVETCSGTSNACPLDAKKPAETVCRAAVRGTDGTTCDATETCDGTSNECPEDDYLPAGTGCRAAADACDVADTCAGGTSKTCPADLRKDHGYIGKCAKACYVCAIDPAVIVLGNGRAYNLGGCGIGKCDNFVALPWPSCVSQCLPQKCENNRGLSNAGVHTCQKADGSWKCDYKVEGGDVANGHCPLWG